MKRRMVVGCAAIVALPSIPQRKALEAPACVNSPVFGRSLGSPCSSRRRCRPFINITKLASGADAIA